MTDFTKTRELPIFPLRSALFPGNRLQLQIFEQRYLDLVTATMKSGEPFVVSPIKQGHEVGEPATIFPCGVTVNIFDWSQQPNGLLNITIEAHQRVRVVSTRIADKQLMYGEVQVLAEAASQLACETIPQWLQLLEQVSGNGQWGENPDFSTLSVGDLTWRLASLFIKDAQTGAGFLTTEQPEIRLNLLKRLIADVLGQQVPPENQG